VVQRLATSLVVFFVLVAATGKPVYAAKVPPCGDSPGDRPAVTTVLDSASASCPCDGFAKPAKYVSCVNDVAKAAVAAGTLRKVCKAQVLRGASRSTCGRPAGAVTCCKTTAKGKATCGVATSTAKCTATKGGAALLGATNSCSNACLPTCEELNVRGAQLDAAVQAALTGMQDPWGAELPKVVGRVAAELGCRLVTAPSASRAGLATTQAAATCPDCDTVGYCGSSQVGPQIGEGSCMNQYCYEHDNCYPQSCVDKSCQFFTTQGSAGLCDDTFFARCADECANADWESAAICRVAHFAKDYVNPLLFPNCQGPPCSAGQTCNATTGMCETPTPTPTPSVLPTPGATSTCGPTSCGNDEECNPATGLCENYCTLHGCCCSYAVADCCDGSCPTHGLCIDVATLEEFRHCYDNVNGCTLIGGPSALTACSEVTDQWCGPR
jgi:hypothetical protein